MSNHATALSATLVDEWVRAGVRFAFVAPGSRSTPLALALWDRPELVTEIALDERVAGFMALGVGLATGEPAVVLTTSGTATTHLHAAVVEADLAEVPMIVCTADRPPELHGVGAAQTIDQRRLFGTSCRAYLDLGVPDAVNRPAWRSLAARAFCDSMATPAGPVQLNLCFRDPLVGTLGVTVSAEVQPDLPPGRPSGMPWHRRVAASGGPPAGLRHELGQRWVGAGRRGLLVAGAGVEDPEAVLALARRLGWPVLADPRSGCRRADPVVVAHAHALLRVGSWAQLLRPEVIVSLGSPHASKVVTSWLAAMSEVGGSSPHGADWVQVNRGGSWWDPDRRASLVLQQPPGAFAAAMLSELAQFLPVTDRIAVDSVDGSAMLSGDSTSIRREGDGTWLGLWRRADDAAALALTRGLRVEASVGDRPNEPAVARATLDAARRHQAVALVVSSSMPIRDLEWFSTAAPASITAARRHPDPVVLANRGANGIDGVVATAAGVALATGALGAIRDGEAEARAVWLLIGDLALLHDSNALLSLARRPLRLRLVVVDNGGGGIFSFLPQARLVDPDRFEQLFGTAQAIDLVALLNVHGLDTTEVSSLDRLEAALDDLAASRAPVAALVVRCLDRAANVAVHARLEALVARALESLSDAAPSAGDDALKALG